MKIKEFKRWGLRGYWPHHKHQRYSVRDFYAMSTVTRRMQATLKPNEQGCYLPLNYRHSI